MKSVKSKIVRLARSLGYDITRYRTAIKDIERLVHNDNPLIFDIGANLGQTITLFKNRFPKSTIHSFEPSAETFEKLKVQVSGKYTGISLHKYAVGATVGKMNFHENAYPNMSSFLPIGEYGWGTVVKDTTVDVITIDQFVSENKIQKIDCLKSDTQGFELEVFKGARRCFEERRIGLVYFETIFSEMYKGLPSFGEVFDFLTKNDFLLVALYEVYYQDDLASWSDALFIHRSYIRK